MGIFSKKKNTSATIRRIWHSPPPGAPWYYWTYVLFEARGEPIEVKLTKRQAKNFVKMYSERTKLLPIKVSEGDLALPPHVRNLYEGSIRILLLMAGQKNRP